MQTPRFAPQASGSKVTIPGKIIGVKTYPARSGFSVFGFQIFEPIPETYTIIVELDLETVKAVIRRHHPHHPDSLAALTYWRDPAPIYPPRFEKHLGSDPSSAMLQEGTRVNVLCQVASLAEQHYTGSRPFMVRSVELAE
ncbi:hypothetical protein COV06_00315 [Candidatus Uhrbacteria bacterium CG10_big_fil_rev_8_21_14_0_10_50_16]|uniref:Uncharacterized protein n=1 Tax=Candidatus Uhrbacteria bacterium CG10_big_fil_rev_8_21_14_0_10_50_16 TaxID=1975039 RepID=A0A2H0RPB4_9BACT|nr:MAG: hypothetical protein COV06_00315 [Candidatus Uhrbacteria bacterium CG10_big_fil_rev_8_21_14_0_10_50_16]